MQIDGRYKQRKRAIRLTLKRLKEVLHYNADTGQFAWKKFPRRNYPKWLQPGSLLANGYVRIYIDGEGHLAHRLAWFLGYEEWPSQIDHIDGNRANNRLDNLRCATPSQNHQNKRMMPTNKSGLKGAWKNKENGKWRSAIKVNGKIVCLGNKFNTREAAHKAYCAAAKRYYGQYARTR